MNKFLKAWYQLTAYIPRKLPTDDVEYTHMAKVLMEAYGVSDEPNCWVTVAGQVTSTPGHKLRRPWGHIANQAKRLRINELASKNRMAGMQAFADKLEAAAKKVAAQVEAEEKEKNAKQSSEEIQQEAHAVQASQASEASQKSDGPEVSVLDPSQTIGVGYTH